MKRLSYARVSLAVAAVAIVFVGVLRDPDTANADEVSGQAVARDHMPGYQSAPDTPKFASLTQAELAKLNAPVDGDLPTF